MQGGSSLFFFLFLDFLWSLEQNLKRKGEEFGFQLGLRCRDVMSWNGRGFSLLLMGVVAGY